MPIFCTYEMKIRERRSYNKKPFIIDLVDEEPKTCAFREKRDDGDPAAIALRMKSQKIWASKNHPEKRLWRSCRCGRQEVKVLVARGCVHTGMKLPEFEISRFP